MNFKKRQQIIMNRYLKPLLKKNLGDEYETLYSSRCADELRVKVEYVKNKIKEIAWDGKGCAIFQASTDLFIEKINQKEQKEVQSILEEYLKMLEGKNFDKKLLDNLTVFENVNKQYNRLSCAKMICNFFNKKD